MGLEKLNPFSVIGDIAGGYGAIKSAETYAKTAEKNLEEQRKARAEKQQAIDAGVTGPHWSTGRPGGVGTPIITAPHKGTPFDIATQRGGEEAEKFQTTTGTFGDVASPLAEAFKTKYPSAIQDPLSLDAARAAATADENRLKNAILNPAIEKIAALGKRTQGDISGIGSSGMSGTENIVSNFMEKMLPQIQMKRETDAFNRVNTDVDRYGRQTGQVGGQALSTSGGGYMPPPITGPSFTSGISPMMQMSAPPLAQPDMTGYAGAAGASNIFNSIAAMQNQAAAREDYNRLLTVLGNRGLGDAMTYGGSFPQSQSGLG